MSPYYDLCPFRDPRIRLRRLRQIVKRRDEERLLDGESLTLSRREHRSEALERRRLECGRVDGLPARKVPNRCSSYQPKSTPR
jgi:hypothetical protein